MILLICIKQHQSNIWSSIHENVKQQWGWVEKKVLLIKKACSKLLSNSRTLSEVWKSIIK